MTTPIVLLNTNIEHPLVSPVGLEYVGESVVEAGAPVHVIDLAFEVNWRQALSVELGKLAPLLVGITVRNVDDSSSITRKSFLPWIREVVAEVRKLTDGFILLGGVGFSIMPETVLEVSNADAGVYGDGEVAVPILLECLIQGKDFTRVPNLIYRQNGKSVFNPSVYTDLRQLPPPRRHLFDNRRYEELGAMVGIETKRGCSQKCIFCADPVARGRHVRLRPPQTVVLEFRNLLNQSVSWFHLSDSEFNLPIDHAKDVCREIIKAGIGDTAHWYTYCAPVPFDRELIRLMKEAGCAGINFGVDSLDDGQLRRLGRTHTVNDVEDLVGLLNREGLNYMFDLLVGAPGETVETVRTTIEKARGLEIPLTGIASGVRVYRGSPLGTMADDGLIKEGLQPGEGYDPLYYLSPPLSGDTAALLKEIVGGDNRFLVLSSPEESGSYNYAGDETLSKLIREGARGAYWDILRQHRAD